MSWLGKYMFASMLLAFMMTSAQAAQQATPKDPGESFQVRFNDGYLTVKAREAPLVKVFDEIRKQAGIAVDGSIGPEERITIQFERVALEEGLKRLAKNISIVYMQGPKDKSPRIERIVVLPEKEKAAPPAGVEAPTKSSKTSEPTPQPEPFKFEFDPTKSVEKQKKSQ
jgi:hypothetical protein